MLDKIKTTNVFVLTFILLLAIFIVDTTRMPKGLWLLVMVIIVIAPIVPGFIATQGKNVFWGCIGGFVFAFFVWLILRIDYALLFLIGLALAYLYAFFMRKSVMYSIAMTQICLIAIFDYTDPNLKGFFVLDRGLAALLGIALVYAIEYMFLKLYAKKIDDAIIQKVKDARIRASAIILAAINSSSVTKIEALQRELFREYEALNKNIIEMESRFTTNDEVLTKIKNMILPIKDAIYILQISNTDDKTKLIEINQKLAIN